MTYSLLHGLATYPYAAANKSLGFGALLSSLKTSNQYASSIASKYRKKSITISLKSTILFSIICGELYFIIQLLNLLLTFFTIILY